MLLERPRRKLFFVQICRARFILNLSVKSSLKGLHSISVKWNIEKIFLEAGMRQKQRFVEMSQDLPHSLQKFLQVPNLVLLPISVSIKPSSLQSSPGRFGVAWGLQGISVHL